MNWEEHFDKVYGEVKGASDAEIETFVREWNCALSEEEIEKLQHDEQNPFSKGTPYYEQWKPTNFGTWKFPARKLPESYLAFLKFCNSRASFVKGEREMGFFGTTDFRGMNLAYQFPEYMEGGISFGLDGCGNHLIFDMREAALHNEYQVYGCHSGSLDWEEATLIAGSFVECCKGTISIDDLLHT